MLVERHSQKILGVKNLVGAENIYLKPICIPKLCIIKKDFFDGLQSMSTVILVTKISKLTT